MSDQAQVLTSTVRNLLDSKAFPLHTTCVAAPVALNRIVRWIVIAPVGGNQLAPGYLAVPYLEGGDVVLLAPTWQAGGLTDPGAQHAVIEMIRQCAERDASAIAIAEALPPLVIAAAESAGVPLLQLPENVHLRDIERAITGLLLGHQSADERRSMQIYEQLIALAADNITLDRLIPELSRYTGKAVLLQDKNCRRLHESIPPEYAAMWDDISTWLTDRRELPSAIRDRHRLPRHASPTVRQPIPNSTLVRLITPIITQYTGRGYLSFIADAEQTSTLDALILDHGAAVCALEMARAKAISEVQKKLRGDFLDSLIMGVMSESEALIEGDRFGHDMNTGHVALVIAWYGQTKMPSMRRLETLVNGLITRERAQALTQLREKEMIVFLNAHSDTLITTARNFALAVVSEAHREFPETRISVGIGTEARRVSDWRRTYLEAAQAGDIARRLKTDDPAYIADLGIYTFLTRPDFKESLRSLRDTTIGALVHGDERQRADLLTTLEAFFQAHGNHTQTAEKLSVHRNTLFYRMTRISETIKMDLNSPDVRLAVHLALKIHRLLENEDQR